MAVTGRVSDKKRLDMPRIYSSDVATRDKLTGYCIMPNAEVFIYHKGELVTKIKVQIDSIRPYFYVDGDKTAYGDFEVAYKEAMTQNGHPVYYEKVM